MSELRVDNLKTTDSSFSIDTSDIASRDVDDYEIIKGVYWPKVNCTDQGDIAEIGSLAYIISQAAGADRMIELGPGAYTLATSLTVPVTCGLRFNKNAIITVAAAKTLTINGSLEAGIYQIFSGTGTITLGVLVRKVYGEWWGGSAFTTLADSATPSVAQGHLFLTGGTTTITNFTGSTIGREIQIFAEHAITITDGTNIFLNGSANFDMNISDVLFLTQKLDGKWYETNLSDNT